MNGDKAYNLIMYASLMATKVYVAEYQDTNAHNSKIIIFTSMFTLFSNRTSMLHPIHITAMCTIIHCQINLSIFLLYNLL